MPVVYQTFDQLVTAMVERWAAEVGVDPVFESGDPLLAIFQAAAAMAIMLENVNQQAVLFARASTATGSDLDSFVADFGLSRLGATKASGVAVFSTATPASSNIPIPIGTIVQTPGAAIQYQTVEDASILQNQTSATVKIEALFPGAGQNVQADQLTQFSTVIPGVSFVTNPNPITNGLDAETDQQLRDRFVLFFASLSKATEDAILFAINSVQQGLDIALLDNTDVNGNPRNGFFTVVIDDGSGSPPQSLLDAVYAAVDKVRAFTIGFAVIAPTLVHPDIALNIKIKPDSPELGSTVENNVKVAVLEYVNSLDIGEPLYLLKLAQVAIDCDVNVVGVQPNSVLINGVEADLIPTVIQLIRTTVAQITIGLY